MLFKLSSKFAPYGRPCLVYLFLPLSAGAGPGWPVPPGLAPVEALFNMRLVALWSAVQGDEGRWH